MSEEKKKRVRRSAEERLRELEAASEKLRMKLDAIRRKKENIVVKKVPTKAERLEQERFMRAFERLSAGFSFAEILGILHTGIHEGRMDREKMEGLGQALLEELGKAKRGRKPKL